MNKIPDADIKELKEIFNLVKSRYLTAILALKTVKASNTCVELFNNTTEGNIFNICRQSSYLRCIVEVRRILEPSSKDKVANLKYLIEQTYKNKEYFAQEHYNIRLTPDVSWVGEVTPERNPELSNFFDDTIKYMANEEKMKCLEKMELINHRWECFWELLRVNKDFSFIRDTRDELVHSFNIVTVKAAPMNKMQKMMNLILWFIKKLDYIINDTSSHYEYLNEQAENIALNFWKKVKYNDQYTSK